VAVARLLPLIANTVRCERRFEVLGGKTECGWQKFQEKQEVEALAAPQV
jgi:hypothetical protein